MTFADFRRTKAYDLIMALPLILWFGGAAVRLRPSLVVLGAGLTGGQVTWHGALLFFALFASATFNLLLVWLLIARSVPVRRAPGLLARACGFVGTFLGVAILYLPPVQPSLPLLILSDLLLILGFGAAVVIVSRLGRAFSIMPEARVLVTTGAYGRVRHPLYVAEVTGLAGNAILFRQPWALLLLALVIALQVARSRFEEQVLGEAFPEYAGYRARTRRFIPGVW
jgi:protein-S-isoprenylcysteine O-methyltransferase Ste14